MSPESHASLDPSWFCSRSPSSSFHGLVLLPGISWPFLCFGLFVSSFLHRFWSSLVFLLVFLSLSPACLSCLCCFHSWSSWFSLVLVNFLSWSLLVLLVFTGPADLLLVYPSPAGLVGLSRSCIYLPCSCWYSLVMLVFPSLSGPFWSFLVLSGLRVTVLKPWSRFGGWSEDFLCPLLIVFIKRSFHFLLFSFLKNML